MIEPISDNRFMLSKEAPLSNPDSAESEKRRFGRYRVLRHLATGGMGEVYIVHLAGPSTFRRLLVLKTIKPDLVTDNDFRIMFEQEARIAGMMDHPNICHAFEFGYEQGRPYLLMEYLTGVGMDQYIRKVVRSPDLSDVRVTLSLLLQACHGLQYAHELADEDGQPAALVHRDVTPSNLMVSKEGVLRILDFGIARTRARLIETRTGAIKGKYCYMPPEQVQGHPVDRRADVFSMGVLLWEGIVGRPLFAHPSEYETIRAVVEEIPALLDTIRPGLTNTAAVVARALEKSRTDRYDTANALGHALVHAMRLDGIGEPLPPFLLADELAKRMPDLLSKPNADEFDPLIAGPTTFDAIMSLDDRPAGTTAIDLDPTRSSGPISVAGTLNDSVPPTVAMTTVVTVPADLHVSRMKKMGAVAAAAAVFVTAAVIAGASRAPHVSTVSASSRPSSSVALPAALPILAAPKTHVEPAPTVTVPAAVVEPAPERTHRASSSEGRSRPHRVAPGSLTVEARPYGTVYIDGKRVAVTPLVKHPLSPGKHAIKVVGSNGRSDSFVIRTRSGEDAPPKLIMLE